MLIKKELDTILVKKYPKLTPEERGKNIYVAAVDVVKLNRSGNIFVVDVFKICDHSLQLRFFSDGVSFLVCKAWPVKEWFKRLPSILLDYSWISATEADEKKTHKFLGNGQKSWNYGRGIANEMHEFVSGIYAKKQSQAMERKYSMMKDHFAMFPNYPKDLSEYCERNVFGSTYLFVSKCKW
jgi:hypothetical protein